MSIRKGNLAEDQIMVCRTSCSPPAHNRDSFTTISCVLMTCGWSLISDSLGTIPLKPLLLDQVTSRCILIPISCSQTSWRLKCFKRTITKQSWFPSSTFFKHVPQSVCSRTVCSSCTSTCAPSPSALQAPAVCWCWRQILPSQLQSYTCTWNTRCVFAGYVSVFLPKGVLTCHKSVIWVLEILLKTAY